MARNNIKLLDSYQLKYIKQRYHFTYDKEKDVVIVSIDNYNRSTIHSGSTTFCLNTKVRRISITAEMLDIWKTLLCEPNLIDVQQAVNILYVTYQKVTVENVQKILQKNRIKLKTI